MYNLLQVTPESIPGLNLDLTYYLSGPMKGYPNHNWPAFERNASFLREYGLKIKSPHEVNPTAYVGADELEKYPINFLKADIIEMLSLTEAIILTKGWPTSRGSRAELDIALDLEYPVWFYDNYRLVRMNYDPAEESV